MENKDCAIVHDRLDRIRFDGLYDENKNLQGAVKKADFAKAKELCRDVVTALIKFQPEVAPEVDPPYAVNKLAMQEMLQTPQYQEVHTKTAGSRMLTSVAANAMMETLSKKMPEEHKKHAERAARQEADRQMIEQQIEALHDALNQQVLNDEELQQTNENIQHLEGELTALEQQINQTLPPTDEGGQMRRVLRQAALDGSEAAEEVMAVAEAFGLGHSLSGEEGGEVDIADMLSLCRLIKDDPHLRRVFDLLGRFNPMGTAARKHRLNHGPDDVADVEQGNDLSRVLPSEFALLKHPLARRIFFKKFAAGELLQMELKIKEPAKKGPIIFFCDISGSMAGAPHAEAKAFGLSFIQMAQAEKRDLYLVNFSHVLGGPFKFTKGKTSPAQIVAFARQFDANGGTNFDNVLMETLRILSSEPDYQHADVVMLTDGIAPITADILEVFRKEKQRLSFWMGGVMVGQESPKVLSLFCDVAVPARSLLDPSQDIERLMALR